MIVPKVDQSPVAKAIMRPYTVPLLFSLVHLGIISLSITAEGGTAPIAEFAGVFDPAGEPQKAMVGESQSEVNANDIYSDDILPIALLIIKQE